MTARAYAPANAVARHLVTVEDFKTYAAPALEAAPLWVPGRCFNPACGCAFTPARSWQVYCSTSCERAGTAEFRRWGHRMALPLLAWRVNKYQPGDTAAGELARVARRHVTEAQSAWLRERAAAIEAAGCGS
ncbi:hypothetical protein [uncultured Maritimibacter sp.]|uniref:hypothetical protein n=1 Tax=uncultured Maritimibacter sp. TaxID=991866 RepID=UPI00261A4B7B|nr:hypothetical protein [uncultured Maritimibacter sp.]